MTAKRILPTKGDETPEMPQRGPFVVQVEAGRRYVWCSCGRSAKQPWCDGSHAGTGFEPIAFEAWGGSLRAEGTLSVEDPPGYDTWGGAPVDGRLASAWGLPGSYDPTRRLIYWGIANPMPNTRLARHGGDSDAIRRSTPLPAALRTWWAWRGRWCLTPVLRRPG